ncbi:MULTISPECIES: PadR family transcriptional regulator [Bacillaceae]|uniref:PadR family transcriptional regulator n=1 Tax=Bacillaceae TaxID=186817 RepID=UPI00047D5660|nr:MULTISPECIES: PadR family transcriptional regulator [Bacillaceae]UOE95159.1 PadR family transcriptional regulator [Alkalihalobacillus sp. LMS39]
MAKQQMDPTLLILTSLAESSKHGYLIMEDIEVNYQYSMGAGTLYGALKRLEDKGYIKALEGDKKRRPYELTMQGKQFLQDQLNMMERIITIGNRRLGLL